MERESESERGAKTAVWCASRHSVLAPSHMCAHPSAKSGLAQVFVGRLQVYRWRACVCARVVIVLNPRVCCSTFRTSDSVGDRIVGQVAISLVRYERLQHARADAAVVFVGGVWPPAGGRGRVQRLLAADGGGRGPAAQPEHPGQDGAALGPVARLLRGRPRERPLRGVRVLQRARGGDHHREHGQHPQDGAHGNAVPAGVAAVRLHRRGGQQRGSRQASADHPGLRLRNLLHPVRPELGGGSGVVHLQHQRRSDESTARSRALLPLSLRVVLCARRRLLPAQRGRRRDVRVPVHEALRGGGAVPAAPRHVPPPRVRLQRLQRPLPASRRVGPAPSRPQPI
ncbi:uncharacterized protein LOC144037839 isoform X1 [Vanacampus margaritifer]